MHHLSENNGWVSVKNPKYPVSFFVSLKAPEKVEVMSLSYWDGFVPERYSIFVKEESKPHEYR
jgi:hypothetical protein